MQIYAVYIWVALGVALIGMEILAPGFVLMWFGIGSLAAGVVAYLKFGIGWQIVTFCAVSLVLVVGARRLLVRTGVQPEEAAAQTNVYALVGKEGLVVERIENVKGSGAVKIGGEVWKGRAVGRDTIEVDTPVVITGIEGATVLVEPKEEGQA